MHFNHSLYDDENNMHHITVLMFVIPLKNQRLHNLRECFSADL